MYRLNEHGEYTAQQQMDDLQELIELLKNPIYSELQRRNMLDSIADITQHAQTRAIEQAAVEALSAARGDSDEAVARDAVEMLVAYQQYQPKPVKITPHKGGRSERIYARVTPQTKRDLTALVAERQKTNPGYSIADWIEEQLSVEDKGAITRPE